MSFSKIVTWTRTRTYSEAQREAKGFLYAVRKNYYTLHKDGMVLSYDLEIPDLPQTPFARYIALRGGRLPCRGLLYIHKMIFSYFSFCQDSSLLYTCTVKYKCPDDIIPVRIYLTSPFKLDQVKLTMLFICMCSFLSCLPPSKPMSL